MKEFEVKYIIDGSTKIAVVRANDSGAACNKIRCMFRSSNVRFVYSMSI